MVGSDHRLLGRDHAADRRAVLIAAAGIARTDALNPGDAFGWFAVRPPDNMAVEGPGSREHALELDAGHNIRVPAVTVFALLPRIEFFKTGGQDNRTDIQLD